MLPTDLTMLLTNTLSRSSLAALLTGICKLDAIKLSGMDAPYRLNRLIDFAYFLYFLCKSGKFGAADHLNSEIKDRLFRLQFISIRND